MCMFRRKIITLQKYQFFAVKLPYAKNTLFRRFAFNGQPLSYGLSTIHPTNLLLFQIIKFTIGFSFLKYHKKEMSLQSKLEKQWFEIRDKTF